MAPNPESPKSSTPASPKASSPKPTSPKGKAPASPPPKSESAASPVPATPALGLVPEPTTEPTPQAPPEDGELQPGSHWNQDNFNRNQVNYDDSDSAYIPDEESTASISSSIFEYRSVNGRTYHSDKFDAKYWGANDLAQSETMDIQHHVWTVALDGKLFLAPLKPDIEKAVDIGTGTGIWAIDFGDAFPNCHVIGTDISLNQQSWTPPNVEFQIDDLALNWTFKDNSLDYIHLRWMVGSITDWARFMEQAYRALKPGGWVETYDTDGGFFCDDNTVAPDSALGQWFHIFTAGSKKLGSEASFRIVGDREQRRSIEAAGFTNIHEVPFKIPVGAWPLDPRMKDLGRMQQHVLESDTEGFFTMPANALGWSKEQIIVFAATMRREVRSTKHHAYLRCNVAYAQKPF